MHRLSVLYPTPADPAAFRDYYLTTHLPIVAGLPGLLASRHSLHVASPVGESAYFAVWEGDFASAEDMAEALASPAGQQAVADVPNFATGGAQLIHFAIDR